MIVKVLFQLSVISRTGESVTVQVWRHFFSGSGSDAATQVARQSLSTGEEREEVDRSVVKCVITLASACTVWCGKE